MDITTEIYNMLTKKSYNRDEPYLKDKLKERLYYLISHNKPIKLVGFWGVGPKSKSNWADLTSCEFFAKLNEEVKELYQPGIEFTFIFATLHGSHNGIIRETIDSYTTEWRKFSKNLISDSSILILFGKDMESILKK